ncbi:hypothetical protein IPM09_02240 [Candidatus Saccharibacteria bacterium]|nr:MAG: hypothetical protein IPM09_02240 [Candidatus Saccharibacteria bacterium]
MSETGHFKDAGLDRLARDGNNVAQFASYDETGNPRYSRVVGLSPNYQFSSLEEAVDYLLANTTEHSLNVRSFAPNDAKSKPFDYELKTSEAVLASLRARQAEGLHTIINETVSIHDGGVSGVVHGDVVEFAPHDTPRCVEKPGTVVLSRKMGRSVIYLVYGIVPKFPSSPEIRQEFSIHPLRHGFRNEHTIVWETEHLDAYPERADTQWPNRFSDMLGDKTFGLIVANQIGLRVPRTTVFNRTVAPFTFGDPTGSPEPWIRTAPNHQTPGKYTTERGWLDPFMLMQREDPTGKNIASILRQDGVDAKFSGACAMGSDGELIIEGKQGFGDRFMVGEDKMNDIPPEVQMAIEDTYYQAQRSLGPVRFEWVYDGKRTWVVQLHRGVSVSSGTTIYPEVSGSTVRYIGYDTSRGLESLREMIGSSEPGTGIMLIGDVGITSHFGDVLRKARIPSKLLRKVTDA